MKITKKEKKKNIFKAYLLLALVVLVHHSLSMLI